MCMAAGLKESLAVPTAQSGQTSKQATEENENENDKQLAAAVKAFLESEQTSKPNASVVSSKD